MFENLTERLSQTVKQLRGQGRLTEDNIQDTLREVRRALLEADVALDVTQGFIKQVQAQALGQEVLKSLTPGQELIRVVRDELTNLMAAGEDEEFNLNAAPPVVVLVAGLQGSGKTTSVAKFALWLKERHKKSVMVVSCDIYRPAAIQQLETLAGQVGALHGASQWAKSAPSDIAEAALRNAALFSQVEWLRPRDFDRYRTVKSGTFFDDRPPLAMTASKPGSHAELSNPTDDAKFGRTLRCGSTTARFKVLQGTNGS